MPTASEVSYDVILIRRWFHQILMLAGIRTVDVQSVSPRALGVHFKLNCVFVVSLVTVGLEKRVWVNV